MKKYLFALMIVALGVVLMSSIQGGRFDIYGLRPAPTSATDAIAPVATNSGYKWGKVSSATARGFSEYTALIDQDTTGPLVETILYQDLGDTITWTHVSTGLYKGIVDSGLFTLNKSIAFWTFGGSVGDAASVGQCYFTNDSTVFVTFIDATFTNANLESDAPSFMTIRVYD